MPEHAAAATRACITLQLGSVKPPRLLQMRIDDVRELVKRLDHDIVKAEQTGSTSEIGVTFTLPDGLVVPFRFSLIEARDRSRLLSDAIARAVAPGQPVAKVDKITRDARGEMVEVETRFIY